MTVPMKKIKRKKIKKLKKIKKIRELQDNSRKFKKFSKIWKIESIREIRGNSKNAENCQKNVNFFRENCVFCFKKLPNTSCNNSVSFLAKKCRQMQKDFKISTIENVCKKAFPYLKPHNAKKKLWTQKKLSDC